MTAHRSFDNLGFPRSEPCSRHLQGFCNYPLIDALESDREQRAAVEEVVTGPGLRPLWHNELRSINPCAQPKNGPKYKASARGSAVKRVGTRTRLLPRLGNVQRPKDFAPIGTAP